MPLSLTTRRRFQTSSATKWTSQDSLIRQQHQHLSQPTVRKQRSFIEQTTTKSFASSYSSGNSRPYLTRGLSVGRKQDTQDIQRVYPRHLLKKHSSIGGHNSNSNKNEVAATSNSIKSEDLIKKNITACGQIDRQSRSIQAWSSTSSILKSLDKELAQLNGVLGKAKDSRNDIGTTVVDSSVNNSTNKNTNKTKTDSGPSAVISAANSLNINNKSSGSKTHRHNTEANRTADANKVNLSIVLSHALNGSKESDYILSDQPDDDDDDDESDALSSDDEKLRSCEAKSQNSKKPEVSSKALPGQQKRLLYQSSKLSTNSSNNLANNNQQSTNIVSGLQNPQNFNVSPSLTIQKRPPLVRAMSAPVRGFDENSKGAFLANKRKPPRRRKLNARTITCDRDSSPPDHLINVKDLNLGSSADNKKILQRSRSIAPDVITLVSLISSEGSDSEKEDCASTPPTSDCPTSPTRRAPSLRKAGKSVSFQENYPPTFQFASKEYSHMLRRGSIAPLAARIKSNRPPTAPPVSIFHTAANNNNNNIKSGNISKTMATNEHNVKTDSPINDNNKDNTSTTTTNPKKTIEEESYQYPEYVRSIKERECWKLFQKMSTKGVNITYDTILRGMLTPTEFRQLQKQRDAEEAKVLKESEELAALQEEQLQQQQKTKKSVPVERLAENLINN